MNISSEQDLLIKARSFDLETLGVIYDLYSPGIYRYAMRLLGDESLSEDCVGETFSKFLTVIRSGRGPKNYLKAYLYRMAHNWIVDSYRRQQTVSLEMNEESMQVIEHHLPEDQVHRQMEQDKVRMAIRKLTPDQQQVIALRFIEGWENDEVAAALKKPVGAIKALQHRALKMLRKVLITDGEEGGYEPKK